MPFPLAVQKVVGILASCSDGVAAFSVSSRVVESTTVYKVDWYSNPQE